ncbi:MAG TPA: glycoside hydrolase family 5 protein [Verrucomicrobiae bacterium]|nr:glycoside hydrolase family 5 protein [Verrucomicrobiae bacterium]
MTRVFGLAAASLLYATTAWAGNECDWLQVKDGQLCNSSGRPAQLRGFSSHDLKFFPFGSNTVSRLARDWRVNIVRAAMYVDSYGSSYLRQPEVQDRVKQIVAAALREQIYVIIDWHILQDGNPQQHEKEARAFLEEMAQAYGSRPNVLFEICNEPNGHAVTWPVIKSYAEAVIPAIRAAAPRSIIIVGTDTWSQGVRAAAQAPLSFSNVVYALHFYAGTHRAALRQSADAALAAKLPIFVSEWGLTDYSGKGPLDLDEGRKWMDWMNEHKISWLNWSFSAAPEASAALQPHADINGPWRDSDLNPSGLWVKEQLARAP